MPRPRTGSVYEHDGHLDVRITMPDGTRSRPLHLRTLRAERPEDWERARAYAQKKTDDAAAGLLVRDGEAHDAPIPASSTMAGIAARWVDLVKVGDLAPGTKKGHERAARRVAERFGHLTPDKVGTPELRAWLRDLKASGLAPVTVRAIFFSLSKLFEDAMAEAWIDLQNPCRHPTVRGELPAVEVPDDEDKARHSAAEAAQLVLDPRVPAERRFRYLLAFTTGMRDGELAGLRWSSLVVRSGVLCYRVHQALALKGEDGRGTYRKPKTRSSKRLVPVHPAAALALEQWRATGWRARVGRDPQDHDPILPSPAGLPYRPESAELFRADLESVGLPVTFEGTPYTFHSTRRTFTSILEAKGVPGSHVDRLIGEADLSTRGRHYAGVDLAVLAAAVALLELPGVPCGAAPTADPGGVPSGEASGGGGSGPSSTVASAGTCSGIEAAPATCWDDVSDCPAGGTPVRSLSCALRPSFSPRS